MKVAPTSLCPKTLRLKSKYGEKKWEDWLEEQVKIPVSQLFKGRKYFEDFLFKYKKIPNRDELLVFYYNRYVVAKKKSTLPMLTEQWSVQFIQQYTKVFQENNITIDAALQILEKSRPRSVREELEK